MNKSSITPVILAGGSGTRLWPASRKLKPKQFLCLTDEKYSLFQLTALRAAKIPGAGNPIVICNEDHRFLVAEQLLELGIKAKHIILEPFAKNTAPALTLAALADDCEKQIVLPADHLIEEQEIFLSTVEKASQLIDYGYILTFGLEPDRAETGYGYIKKGEPVEDSGYRVSRFEEKPDSQTAKIYLESGDYLWNSGMFCFRTRDMLNELEKFCPEIFRTCLEAIKNARVDIDFLRISAASFEACPSDSIDYAVMEKTDRAAVIAFNPSWSDIGAWDALWLNSNRDENNNAVTGDVILENTSNSLIHANERLVATLGVDGLVIIETADAVLVADKNASQDIKKVVESLKQEQRNELDAHTKVYRPWGWYENICVGDRFQVKRIMVKPHASLSLQRHKYRAEHWVIVKGIAEVTNGKETRLYHEDQSTYIPVGNIHRLENPAEENLEIVEIQTGYYLGEDDIERIEDNYGRLEV